jgi:hypothetical protein
VTRVGSFMTDMGEQEPYDDTPELTQFRVERSDGSSEIVECADEADAIRQANNGYVGPAIVVAVIPYAQIPRRTT